MCVNSDSGFSYFPQDGRIADKSIWIINSFKEHVQLLRNRKGLSTNLIQISRFNPANADVLFHAIRMALEMLLSLSVSYLFFFYLSFCCSSDRKNDNPQTGFWEDLFHSVRIEFPYVLTQACFGHVKRMIEFITAKQKYQAKHWKYWMLLLDLLWVQYNLLSFLNRQLLLFQWTLWREIITASGVIYIMILNMLGLHRNYFFHEVFTYFWNIKCIKWDFRNTFSSSFSEKLIWTAEKQFSIPARIWLLSHRKEKIWCSDLSTRKVCKIGIPQC